MNWKKFLNKIEKENESFKKLSKAEKRVVIAQDCLIRLKNKQIISTIGTTCEMQTYYGEDLKNNINEEKIECYACAKGSLFLSYIGRVNNFNISAIDNSPVLYSEEMKKLLQIFTKKQLDLIEIAFEGYFVCDSSYNIKSETRSKAKRFHYINIVCKEERLINICKNIIKNKGTFKP